MNPSPAEDHSLEGDAAHSTRHRFRFPLPLDPIRLLAGVLTRWPQILAGMLVFGGLGAFVGIQLTNPSYAISVSLIKRRVPQTVQASDTGQAFRPVDLNDTTLLATLLATEPLDLAILRANNGIDPIDAKEFVEATQLEGTDIFYITYHSPISPQDAVTFSGIWAEEINAYTKRLQQAEARDVRAILESEVKAIEKQIESTNLEILNFSKEKNFLGSTAQVSAVLEKFSQIELELETARSTVEAKNRQIDGLMEQIRHQSPLEFQIKTAREDLANLRSNYTDANPLVQAKLQSIAYLEEQIAKARQGAAVDLEAYTGTPLGNQLYLSITTLRNERLDAECRITALDDLRKSTAERMAELPAIISSYEVLQKKRDSGIEALSLMKNRLKEAEIFASGAPGCWQVFQAPDTRSIIPSSRIKKPAILGAAGAIGGAGLSVLLTLLLTQRTARRSILECCAATGSPLICSLPTSLETDARAAIEQLWISHLAPRLDEQTPILFWTAALDPADERRLWTMLADAAFKDTGKPLQVLDLTPDPLWTESTGPSSLQWQACPQDASSQTSALLVRAATMPQHALRPLLSQIHHWISVVAGNKESLRRAVSCQEITDVYLPDCSGTIAWTEKPQGRIREIADRLSCLLAKHFS